MTSSSVTNARCDTSCAGGDAQGWKNEQRPCPACQRVFKPHRRAQLHCSHRCRTRRYRERLETRTDGYYGA